MPTTAPSEPACQRDCARAPTPSDRTTRRESNRQPPMRWPSALGRRRDGSYRRLEPRDSMAHIGLRVKLVHTHRVGRGEADLST